MQMFIRKIMRHSKNLLTENFLRQETSQYERIGRNTDDGHLSKERSADHSSSQSQSAMSVDHQLLSKERSSPKTSTNNVKLIPDADNRGKRKPYEAIAYVLPVKRNKKNTVDYCEMLLRTPNETKRAICFSKSKRPILLDRQQARTPARISNFTNTSNEERRV